MNKYIIYIILLLITSSCISEESQVNIFVSPSDNNLMYEGRIGTTEEKVAKEIYWSGTSIKINFHGSSIKTNLEDEFGLNYFNTILDDTIFNTIHLDKGKMEYILADSLTLGNHTLQLVKRNEWTFGKTLFYGFNIKGREILKPDPLKELFIEFYGNSITEGNGNEDQTGNDRNTGDVTNNYNTYGAFTSRHFKAEYSCIARSGVGVTISWFDMIMPEMYYRLDPSDPSSYWDFKKQPDIVVVNLFQNDKWLHLLPEHPQFIKRFGKNKPTTAYIVKAYTDFIRTLRSKYADTYIICMLGNMDITSEDSSWPKLVSQAVDQLEDEKVTTCFVPFKKTGGHPTVEEHKIMAKYLINTINTKILKSK